MKTREELIGELVRREVRLIRNLIREYDALSKPCPPDGWRWADMDTSGRRVLNDWEKMLAQGRAASRAAALREELALLTGKQEGDA